VQIDTETSTKARTLAGALEPFTGQVYFSPECHAAYEALGFNGSPLTTGNGVAVPDGPAYFTSRAASMGQVPGAVAAAAFGVFDPTIVGFGIAHGWSLTDAATIGAARTAGAVAQLARILGPATEGIERAAELLARAGDGLQPSGRPLFAGMLSVEPPDDPLGRAWVLGDRLREYRGDCHTAAWTSAGYDAVEISLVTEVWWGLPPQSYSRTRGWSQEALDAGLDRLRSAGDLDGDSLTDAGRARREAVEVATDRPCAAIVANLGDDHDELVGMLQRWATAIRDGAGYLPGGPHELAGRG
jgi:hypothetical protein